MNCNMECLNFVGSDVVTQITARSPAPGGVGAVHPGI
jgi:hypothetical protein